MWLDEQSRPDVVWYVKRLSGNDTLATGAHQAGPYITRAFLFGIFPSLSRPEADNPDVRFEVRIDSHPAVLQVRAVWYNNKLRDGTRNETRLTNFGGAASPLLDPDSTGALVVFAFHRQPDRDASICHVWVCDTELEEDLVEDRMGPVEPGRYAIWTFGQNAASLITDRPRTDCRLETADIPPEWLGGFPTGAQIIAKTLELQPSHGISVDARILKRRDCEYEIYQSVEEAIELPIIRSGFSTMKEFIDRAQTILQRRKSRSGRSLELHAKAIFLEENLNEGIDFSHQPESEPGKRPDFLFPSEACYKNPDFPANRLIMLAVKTTCKDRWRQILNEAMRVPVKHLLTLQEGVSESQFREMSEAKVKLVVPQKRIGSFPEQVRPHLMTLESFIADVRLLNQGCRI